MTLRRILVFAATLALPALLHAQDSKTSTPEERKHWVEVLHRLEAQPDDATTSDEAGKVVIRLIEVSDVHLSLCTNFLETSDKYKERKPILQLFMLGLAGYQVETGKTDNDGSNLYALHSVLRGYSVLVANNPKNSEKHLDELVKLDAEGKLPDFIHKKRCK